MRSILVTGSEGLVGRHVSKKLERRGWTIFRLDTRGASESARGDVTQGETVRRKLPRVSGIIHLAAVSRVVTAERDPVACWRTNVGGTNNVIRAALTAASPPWLIFASSRKVYGDQSSLPVKEDCMQSPLNIYARSKVKCEELVEAFASKADNRALIVRLSNVYGCVHDHATRVVPAFCRAAANGAMLKIEGAATILDFTHVDDVAEGICNLVELRHQTRATMDSVHLTTGVGTSLEELANLANDAGGGHSQFTFLPARTYQPSRFVGDKTRAEKLIEWKPRVGIAEGVRMLVGEFAREVSPLQTLRRLVTLS